MNSFGRIFKISIFGESHGKGLGVLIDGCPAGISLKEEDFRSSLLRRKSGKKGTTPRIESDEVSIDSGLFNGFTTGSPIILNFSNENIKSKDYNEIKKIPRPGHADLTASQKYNGFNDYRGGGQFSGRLTLAIVAAGVVAKKLLDGIEINAKITEVGGETDIENAVDKALKDGDSVGGLLQCNINGLPVGLGEPFFDSVESNISHLAFAIPAVKGIEFGIGFKAASSRASDINDSIINQSGKTKSNNSGGINGGITNGNELSFKVAIKPPASISKAQNSVNIETGKVEEFNIKGRHDACIALRFPVILESVAAIVLADFKLIRKTNYV
ncbi:chorismate synthase [Candidatus Kapabacteria bacterium]|nr:chorismate synthase [Candidatus Kapabacteria bacterium]